MTIGSACCWCWLLMSIAPTGGTASSATEEGPPPRISDTVKQRAVLGGDVEAAPRIHNEPIDPTLRGFFDIPGTDARLKIDGYLQVDLIHDFTPNGDTDQFIVRSMPIDVHTHADNTSVHARQSRVNVDLRRPTGLGTLRTFVEGDFFGSSGERVMQLRHAYGHVANLLAGFTNSTLEDPDAKPDTLDYQGPPGVISVRLAQLRYTWPVTRRQSLAFGVEAPETEINTSEDPPITTRTPWPDIVVRYRLDVRRAHVQIGGVWRSMGGFAGDGSEEEQVVGGGVSASGSALIAGHDVLTVQVNAGKGLARYIKGTAGAGLDLGRDAAGEAEAVPLHSVTAGYQHAWHTRWRSTAAVSFVTVRNTVGQPLEAFHRASYATVNLVYKASTAFSAGVELDSGRFIVNDDRRSSGNRVQISAQYAFWK